MATKGTSEVSRVSKTAKDVQEHAHFYGHPLKPIPIREEYVKDVRESTYVEQAFADFLGQYAARGGMSRSHALRRLAILGAQAEGYVFDGATVYGGKP